MERPENKGKLIVLDIDNTVFNWVEYYVACMCAMMDKVSLLTGIPRDVLFEESRPVFEREGSIEYPFLIQELPSVVAYYEHDIPRLMSEAVHAGRQAFNTAAETSLKPYDDVIETLQNVKTLYPEVPIIALTDAPRYVAMWKLNKLGLLKYFSAVYGLPDPNIPIDEETQEVKVEKEILLKHLQKSKFGFVGRIRILPEDYEKPGTKGLKTVLMDHDMESHLSDVLWIGDNLRKDVGLGKRLGVHTGWARYGTVIRADAIDILLQFSPRSNIAKNVALDPMSAESPQPDITLESFSDIIQAINTVLFKS
ncbi:MAG: HAD family hydrolase [Chitinophagaceae bacterium]|nr:HAD family hydrolase [Oligoflexus sp.]